MANELKNTLEALAKRYGKPVVYSGTDVPDIRKIATGVPAYDYVSNGGILVNQNNELYGPFGSLKSFLTLAAMAKFQKYDWGNDEPNAIMSITYKNVKSKSKAEGLEGMVFTEIDKITLRRGYKPKNEVIAKRVGLIDMESTINKKLAEIVGLDLKGLLYYSECSMNEAIDVAEALLRNPEVSLVVIDSMSIIGSDQENEKSMEDDQMATNARLWNKAARKLRSALNSNRDATLIAINATSTKMSAYGDPEEIKNGQQWKLFKSCSVRMNALKEHKAKLDGSREVTVGRMISLKNKKQKFGEPYREAEFYYSFVDDGVLSAGQTDIPQQLTDLGLTMQIITRSGNTYEYMSIHGNGIENFKNKLRENPTAMNKLSEEIYAKF